MKASFKKPREGYTITSKNEKIYLGEKVGGFEQLISGLAHCFYLTIESLAEKRDVQYSQMDMDLEYVRNEGKTKDLQSINVLVSVKDANDEDAVTKTIQKAQEFCSVWVTLSKAAPITCSISFN